MIPWLLILEMTSRSGCSLGSLVNSRRSKFPSSGEINFNVGNPDKIMDRMEKKYRSVSVDYSDLDGISFLFENWRFNLRKSNTESLIRLNVECKNSRVLVAKKVSELSKIIHSIN
jgi:phosphomannomutase